MHWRSALIKSSDIKWKQNIQTRDDGKFDIDVHLPLTELFERQTKQAFMYGIFAMIDFHATHQKNTKLIDKTDLVEFFNGCGLPEIAKTFEVHT